jgi:hypothetical protein
MTVRLLGIRGLIGTQGLGIIYTRYNRTQGCGLFQHSVGVGGFTFGREGLEESPHAYGMDLVVWWVRR